MSYIGGYAIIDFSDHEFTIATDTGSVIAEVDPSDVEKLKDGEKPAMIVGLAVTANGAHISASGFGAHVVQGGVHTHYFKNVAISAIGDRSVQVTIS